MGKQKYLSARKANRNSMFQHQRVSNYLPYMDLANFITSLDIGILNPLCPNLVNLSEVQNKPVGMFRDIRDFVPRLATFYLKVDQYRSDKLLRFDKFVKKDPSSFLFLLSFGGDGAPGVGTVFNISILNVGKRILSSSETFMVFGSDVEESSLSARRFVIKAITDFIYLESKVFSLNVNNNNVNVEFKLCELPNDMKMLCFLAGELSNAAKYFTTFADVNYDNYRDYRKTFGKDWKPFNYQKRLDDSKKVKQKKPDLEKSKIWATTSRQKVTALISTVLKSRQEEIPLVKDFVSVAKCEPLHLKNNVCKDIFVKICLTLYGSFPFKAKSYKSLPENNIFCMLVSFVHNEIKLNLLSKKNG